MILKEAIWKYVRLAKQVYRKRWLDPRGKGRPKSVENWERQFEDGHWEYLDSLDEFFRYMVILGYLHRLWERPYVLDVGCGHGSLWRWMDEFSLSVQGYHGIDISVTAIEQAKSLQRDEVTFQVVDVETWAPTRKCDAIVFNESLYYMADPLAVLRSYAEHLTPDGRLIVSMCRANNHDVIWSKIEAHFPERNRCTVENRTGSVSDIKVLGVPARA